MRNIYISLLLLALLMGMAGGLATLQQTMNHASGDSSKQIIENKPTYVQR